MIRNLITAGALVLAGTSFAHAASESTHEVPEWMNRVCSAEDSVNCWWDGGTIQPKQGQAFIRQMPGTNKVCVLFTNRPAKDYCEKRR
jgi:hypothetical protein